MLDERKLKVLYAIINSHLISAEPIGSRTISKEYNLGVSPATIRNEMSDLEDKGYLSKPHSSAGRIPSDKAYRLYVDEILRVQKPSIHKREQEEVQKYLYEESGEIEDLIRNAAKVLSKLTSYTALAMSPQMNKSKLKHIQLMQISDKKVLMVIMNTSGLVRNSIFRYSGDIADDRMVILSNFLNEKFKNLTIDEIIKKIEIENMIEHPDMGKVLEAVLPEINKALKDIEDVDIYSDGVTKILNFPEYSDLEKAKSFITFMEDKDLIVDLLVTDNKDEDMEIIIGDESDIEELKDCSIITANYKLGNNTIGRVGIVGPKRMDYINLINILGSFSNDITNVINMLLG